MQRTKQLLGAVSAVALIALSSSPAIAAGTTAGDLITNNVSVGYKVGGADQTAVTDSDTFTVDRKVDVTVAEVGAASTVVVPNETQAAITFTVTNNSNDVVDFDLSVDQSTSDDFDITNVKYYIDDGDGIFNAADTLVTYLDEVAEDATVTVHVVGDIPISVTNGQESNVTLIADAHLGGTASSKGAELTNSGANTTNGVETVLADGTGGSAESANEGDHSATDTFVVSSAELSVAKSSTIISDPVNAGSNPKAIPGAVVQYCIAVTNAGTGSATATSVNVNDVLPADVEYLASFGTFVDGDGSCASGTAGGSYNSTDHEVDGTLSDLAPGETKSLYFQVTIK